MASGIGRAYAELVAERDELRARVEELEAGMAPFALEAARRSWVTSLSAKSGMDDMNIGGSGLTNGDLRRAWELVKVVTLETKGGA